MKGTLDLIFARVPTPAGKDTKEYEIFDGHRLVPIWEYLIRHPRPDLIQLDRRMQWLSAGPYGNRSGDILLLSRSGLNQPIQDRYYFSGPYHSWHGSASVQDSHIPLIVARKDYPGAKLKQLVDKLAGSQPSQLALVPIVRALLLPSRRSPPRRPSARDRTSQRRPLRNLNEVAVGIANERNPRHRAQRHRRRAFPNTHRHEAADALRRSRAPGS